MTTALVLELQRDALNGAVPVGTLLRTALAAARKLALPDIESWVLAELNGYGGSEKVPPYRIVHGEVKAWNPYNGTWMPFEFADPHVGAAASQRPVGQSVTELQHLVDHADGRATLQIPFDHAQRQHLMEASGSPFPPTLLVRATAAVQIIETVRTEVLGWALALERDGILGEGMSFSAKERKRAPEVVTNITHFYAPVTGSQIQQFTTQSAQEIVQGVDIPALTALLTVLRSAMPELSLSPEQREELRAEMDTLDAQIRSPKPKSGVVREVLRSARTILEGAAGGALASGLVAEIAKLLGG